MRLILVMVYVLRAVIILGHAKEQAARWLLPPNPLISVSTTGHCPSKTAKLDHFNHIRVRYWPCTCPVLIVLRCGELEGWRSENGSFDHSTTFLSIPRRGERSNLSTMEATIERCREAFREMDSDGNLGLVGVGGAGMVELVFVIMYCPRSASRHHTGVVPRVI